MKYLTIILLCLFSISLKAQQRFPTGFPTQFNSGWNRWGYAMSDSGLIIANRDTTWLPKFSGTVVFRPTNKQFYWFDSTTLIWHLFGNVIDTTPLHNQIILKLNISDTVSMLSPYLRKIDTTAKWVTGMYRKTASDSVFYIKGGQSIFGFRDSVAAGGSGLTSVGISMPSAFTVTNSPLTVNGTIAVSGAGTTSQYIRGNGTLATTDTSMIPSFSVKVRGLFSGAAPITLDQSTGVIGAINANASGTRGVATFNNSDFTDNGSGLISLRNPSGNPGVDTIYRTAGIDSIYFTINGNTYAIKDSSGGGSGTVTSVSGTSNRITVTNPTTTPVIDIAATYVGQTSITTLGTISTGTWNGTTIGPTFGGTGQSTVTTGDLLYGSASNTWSKLADVATGNALISGGVTTAPSWGKIGLTTHVSGILPVANGGTGTATPSLVAGTNISITGTWPNQTINATGNGTVTQVNTGYGLTGGPITTTGTLIVDTTTLKSVYLPLFVNANKIINQSTNNITFAGGGQVIFDSTKHTQTYSDPTILSDSLVSFGNSITFGSNATVQDSAYVNRIASYLGMALTNKGVSGTVAYQACASDLDWINPGHAAMTTFCIGLNDFRSNGGGANMYRGVKNSYEAAMVNQFLASYTPASSCTLWGSWTTNFDAKTNSGGKTTTAAYTSNDNDSLTTDISGTGIGLGVLGIAGNSGSIVVYIDGVKVDSFNTGQQTFATGTQYQSMGKYYTGLSNTSHHVKLIKQAGGVFILIDYVGALVPPASMQPFVFIHIPHMDATGYAGGNATQAILDAANDSLTSAYNRAFSAGLNVYLAQTNNYYNASTSSGLSSDHIHPNDLGMYQIFTAVRFGLSSATATAGTLRYSNNGHLYGTKIDGSLNQIPYTQDLSLQRVLTNGSFLTNPNFISGNNTLDFQGFSRLSLRDFQVLNNGTAYQHGILGVQGSSATLFIGERTLDTTKGFIMYTSGDIFRIFDMYNNSDYIKIDTSFRTLFRNTRTNNVLALPTATIHIGGNILGLASHAPLKIDSCILMSTPEKYAIEATADSLYWTNYSGTRIALNRVSSSGINTLNTLTASTQAFATGTSGSDFNISSSSSTHTFNIPSASTSNRGLVTTTSQTFGGAKTFNDGAIVTLPSASNATALVVSGNRSLGTAPGASGIGLQLASFTYTNTEASTTESGGQNFHLVNTPTLTSSNAVTYSGDVSTIRFVGAPIAGGSSTISHPWNIFANDVNYFQTLSMGLNEQSGDVTLGNGSIPIYTGSGGNTFTLPSLVTHPGKTYFIKNAGSGNLTLARSGSDNLWDTSSVTSITLAAGGAVIVSAGSSFWYIQKTE